MIYKIVIGPSDRTVVILMVMIQPRDANIILKYGKNTKSGFFTDIDHWVITFFFYWRGKAKVIA